MARSLIRLPQLNAGSLAESSFAFATEAGQGILTLDATSGSEKIQAVVDQEMLNKKLSFLNGSSQSVAEISADGSIRIGQTGSEMFEVDAASGDVKQQGDLVLADGANDKIIFTAATGASDFAGNMRVKADIDVGANSADFKYDSANNKFVMTNSGTENFSVIRTSGNMTSKGTALIEGLANLDGGIEIDNGGNVFTVATSGNLVTVGTAEIQGLANLDGGIEVYDSGNTKNVFTVSTAGAIYGDSDITVKGDLAFGASGSEYLKSDSGNTKLTSRYHINLSDGSNDVIKLDSSNGSAYFKGDVSIDGNLTVEGTRTFLNTQESSLADTTLALGMPGGMMDVSYTVTSVDSTTGNGYDEITVTFDAGQVVKSGGLANADKIYLVSSDLAGGFKEGVYTIPAPGGSGANSTLVIQVDAGTYGATSGTAVDAFMSRDVFTQNNPYDGTGLLLPAQDRTVGLLWDGGKTAMELTSAHFRVISNNIEIEKQNGGQKLSFTDGNDSISLTAANPTGTRSITVPDADGLMAVSVATSGGQAQGAENFGLQLSASGQLSIDINAIGGSLNGLGLASGDEIMVSDADGSNEIKKTTLGDLQAFLSSGGTQKQYIVATADANGHVSYSGLSAGFITSLEAASEGSREIYLNGVLMREGSGNDVEVDGANDRLDFTFPIEANDVVLIALRA